jgi:hypothetical protein
MPPTDGEDKEQLIASKKQKRFDASNIIGASNNLALSSPASKNAIHGSPERLIDDQDTTECPYHTRILQEPLSYRVRESSANTMEQFMTHHSGEQYALFKRPDNEKISISRECICLFMRGDDFSYIETKHMLAGEETDLLGFQVGL